MAKAKSTVAILMDNIEALRKLRGWTRSETAVRLHISESAYGNYKSGRQMPPFSLIDSAVRVFGYTAAQLCRPVEEILKEAI